jgi:DNA-binding response OmpR family regulator
MSGHILIADDNAILCGLLQMRLEDEGFAATCVQMWEQVIPAIATDAVDAVLLDATLLTASGWTILEDIRAATQVPIILTINPGAEEIRTRFIGSRQVDSVLVKPFRLQELLNCLQNLLPNSRATAA